MSSAKLDNKLVVYANFIHSLCDYEKQIEKSRIALAEYHSSFNPYTFFKKLDKSSNGYLTEQDLLSFLRQYNVNASESEISLIINRVTNETNQLTYHDFLFQILPHTNKALRNDWLNRYNQMDYSITNSNSKDNKNNDNNGDNAECRYTEALIANIYSQEIKLNRYLQKSNLSLEYIIKRVLNNDSLGDDNNTHPQPNYIQMQEFMTTQGFTFKKEDYEIIVQSLNIDQSRRNSLGYIPPAIDYLDSNIKGNTSEIQNDHYNQNTMNSSILQERKDFMNNSNITKVRNRSISCIINAQNIRSEEKSHFMNSYINPHENSHPYIIPASENDLMSQPNIRNADIQHLNLSTLEPKHNSHTSASLQLNITREPSRLSKQPSIATLRRNSANYPIKILNQCNINDKNNNHDQNAQRSSLIQSQNSTLTCPDYNSQMRKSDASNLLNNHIGNTGLGFKDYVSPLGDRLTVLNPTNLIANLQATGRENPPSYIDNRHIRPDIIRPALKEISFVNQTHLVDDPRLKYSLRPRRSSSRTRESLVIQPHIIRPLSKGSIGSELALRNHLYHKNFVRNSRISYPSQGSTLVRNPLRADSLLNMGSERPLILAPPQEIMRSNRNTMQLNKSYIPLSSKAITETSFEKGLHQPNQNYQLDQRSRGYKENLNDPSIELNHMNDRLYQNIGENHSRKTNMGSFSMQPDYEYKSNYGLNQAKTMDNQDLNQITMHVNNFIARDPLDNKIIQYTNEKFNSIWNRNHI